MTAIKRFKNNADKKQIFSLRKLKAGLASVMIASAFLVAGQKSQVIKADVNSDSDNDNQNHQVENQTNTPDNDIKDFKTQDQEKQKSNSDLTQNNNPKTENIQNVKKQQENNTVQEQNKVNNKTSPAQNVKPKTVNTQPTQEQTKNNNYNQSQLEIKKQESDNNSQAKLQTKKASNQTTSTKTAIPANASKPETKRSTQIKQNKQVKKTNNAQTLKINKNKENTILPGKELKTSLAKRNSNLGRHIDNVQRKKTYPDDGSTFKNPLPANEQNNNPGNALNLDVSTGNKTVTFHYIDDTGKEVGTQTENLQTWTKVSERYDYGEQNPGGDQNKLLPILKNWELENPNDKNIDIKVYSYDNHINEQRGIYHAQGWADNYSVDPIYYHHDKYTWEKRVPKWVYTDHLKHHPGHWVYTDHLKHHPGHRGKHHKWIPGWWEAGYKKIPGWWEAGYKKDGTELKHGDYWYANVGYGTGYPNNPPGGIDGVGSGDQVGNIETDFNSFINNQRSISYEDYFEGAEPRSESYYHEGAWTWNDYQINQYTQVSGFRYGETITIIQNYIPSSDHYYVTGYNIGNNSNIIGHTVDPDGNPNIYVHVKHIIYKRTASYSPTYQIIAKTPNADGTKITNKTIWSWSPKWTRTETYDQTLGKALDDNPWVLDTSTAKAYNQNGDIMPINQDAITSIGKILLPGYKLTDDDVKSQAVLTLPNGFTTSEGKNTLAIDNGDPETNKDLINSIHLSKSAFTTNGKVDPTKLSSKTIYLSYDPILDISTETKGQNYSIIANLPDKYKNAYPGQDFSHALTKSNSIYRTKTYNEGTQKTTYSNWFIKHFYAQKSNGQIVDLGPAEFKQNASGTWGFWDIFNKYHDQAYRINEQQVIVAVDNCVPTIPGYYISQTTNNVPISLTSHFNETAGTSWYILSNLNSVDQLISAFNNTVYTTYENYTPRNNNNKINVNLPGKNAFGFIDTNAIKTDSNGNISLADLISVDSKNQKAFDDLEKNTTIKSVKIGNNNYTFSLSSNGNWLISVDGQNPMDEAVFKTYAAQHDLALRDYTAKTMTNITGKHLSLNTVFNIVDENRRTNTVHASGWHNIGHDWTLDVPAINFNIADAVGISNAKINQTWNVHYIIPTVLENYLHKQSHTKTYTLNISKDYEAENHQETIYVPNYDKYNNPSEDTYPHTINIPTIYFAGWIDTPNTKHNVSIVDLENKDSLNRPLVYNGDLPTPYRDYDRVVYGYDKKGNKVVLGTTKPISFNENTGEAYFTPWSDKLTAQDFNLSNKDLVDPTIGSDVYVEYVPRVVKHTVQYVDREDNPDVEYPTPITSYDLSGKEDSTLPANIMKNIPTGYELDDGQKIPSTYTFNYDYDGSPTIVYVHAKGIVTNKDKTFNYGVKIIIDPSVKEVSQKLYDELVNNGITYQIGDTSNDKIIPQGQDKNNFELIPIGTIRHTTIYFPITKKTQTSNTVLNIGKDTPNPYDNGDGTLSTPAFEILGIWNKNGTSYRSLPKSLKIYSDSKDVADDGSINPQTIDYGAGQNYIYTIHIGVNDTVYEPVIYIDKDTGNEIGRDQVQGKQDSTQHVPLQTFDGYTLDPEQPEVKIQNGKVFVHVQRGKTAHVYYSSPLIKVNHNDKPSKTTDVLIPHTDINYPYGVSYNKLNRFVTRTITVIGSDGKTQDIKQTVHFYRDAQFRLKAITENSGSLDNNNAAKNVITYTDDNGNVLKDGEWAIEGTDNWAEYTPAPKKGYTITITADHDAKDNITKTNVLKLMPKPDDMNNHVLVKYSPVSDLQMLSFVDNDRSMLEVDRKFKDDFKNMKLPQGYTFATKQDEDNFNAAKAGKFNSITTDSANPYLAYIHIREKLDDVSATDQNANISVTREVNIANPDGSLDMVTVKLEMRRHAEYNEVTKVTRYGTWYARSLPITVYKHNTNETYSLDALNINSIAHASEETIEVINQYVPDTVVTTNNRTTHDTIISIPEIHIPSIEGYCKSIDNTNLDGQNLSNEYIPSETVLIKNNQETDNSQLGTASINMMIKNGDNMSMNKNISQDIHVHYVAGSHEMTYRYVDKTTGEVVSSNSILGTAGQTVYLDNTIPSGYKLVPGYVNIYDAYTFTPDDTGYVPDNVTISIPIEKA